MVSASGRRWQAAVVAIAPVVMLAAFVLHPHIGNPFDADFLARLGAAVASNPTLWAVTHYLTAVGGGLMILALLAVRSYLRDAGEERRSAPAVPFLVQGVAGVVAMWPLALAMWTGPDTASGRIEASIHR